MKICINDVKFIDYLHEFKSVVKFYVYIVEFIACRCYHIRKVKNKTCIPIVIIVPAPLSG